MTTRTAGVPAPPPRPRTGRHLPGGDWLCRNLFSSPANTLLTLLVIAALLAMLRPFLGWAVFGATFGGTSQAACTGAGACWTFIRMRLPLLVYGHYPSGQAWRVDLAAALLLAVCVPLLRPRTAHRGWALLGVGACVAVDGCLLVGVPPLPMVAPDNWGGLMLNGVVTVLVTLLALPLGVGLALGRQSPLPVLRSLCVGYIEFWRSLPLLGVLFVSAVMLPLFLPQGVTTGRLLRVVAAMALFNAAYVAEVVRGGLQGVPKEQEEAAASLGLRPLRIAMLVTLPQALQQSIPGLVNTVIDLFKDTTLVSIIGFYELLGTVSQALRDPAWIGLSREGFTFAAGVFFACCLAVSLCSRLLERRLARDRRRLT